MGLAATDDVRIVDFHTMWIIPAWVRQHCVIPDGHQAGEPYIPSEWQDWFYLNFYRVKPDAPTPTAAEPSFGAPAFFYRRAQVVMPQKSGKGPMTASQLCVEGLGPAQFAGWALPGDIYRCVDHGCPCGWIYEYEPGEPKGSPWPTPLIQVTAYSVEQAGNVYEAFKGMVELGPLSDVIPNVAEDFCRLPNGGRIDKVTSSQQSRLGQRVTFVAQDEVGIWYAQNKMDKVAKTQRRGASGMKGRTCETTNAWDPTEQSVAQKTYEASLRVNDIFRIHPQAPDHLNFKVKADRLKILRHLYRESPWVDIGAINAEAEELLLEDPEEAERFYGNRIRAAKGQWMSDEIYKKSTAEIEVPYGSTIAIGFDGSDNNDWTALRAETIDGHRFTPTYGASALPTYWNPAEWEGSIPRGEVNAAVAWMFEHYNVRRMYCDPRDWQSEIGAWSVLYGSDKVLEWATYRIIPMHSALVMSLNDYKNGLSTHDSCKIAKIHFSNARKVSVSSERYILGKPATHQKIDIVMADTLAHIAAHDLTINKAWAEKSKGLTRVKGRARSR